MKFNSQKIVYLLIIFTIIIPRQILAQNLSAETYQPGYWQPVDRFNVKRSVEVLLINKTDIPVEYDITDPSFANPKFLKAGEMGSLKNFGKSAYIVIYPAISINQDNLLTLRFKVKVKETNKIIVDITKDIIKLKSPNFSGHRVINLQKNGGIYIY